MSRNQAERRVGAWELLARLGTGGNATVWRATRGDGRGEVALKVLHSTKVGGEPYRRFQAEVAALRQIDDLGVLPLLDSYLPDALSKNDPAWLAMPIAEPITDALEGQSLDTVVEVAATVAATLDRLRKSHGFAHRDIKPGNLYRFENRWVIGDFGLVAGPDAKDLTQNGRPLGPLRFAASEMIVTAGTADPFPADVYSLAKTLWVLATEQRFPPEGHQASSVREYSIAALRPHANAASLDRLIDACTQLRAGDRPAMDAVAHDLQVWTGMEAPSAARTGLEAARRVRKRLQDQIAAAEAVDQQREAALGAARLLQDLFGPIDEALREAHPGMEIIADDEAINVHLRSFLFMQRPQPIWNWQRISRIPVGPAALAYALRVGRSVELLDDDRMIIRAVIDVSFARLGGKLYLEEVSREVSATPIAPENAIREIVAEVGERLEAALDAFAENLPDVS
jgi:Protein kinase domain